jgi:hypothetical protein
VSTSPDAIPSLLAEVEAELRSAVTRFPKMNSAHEGWAVIWEELDELWTEVRGNDPVRAREEAVQVAAMAVRFLLDVSP